MSLQTEATVEFPDVPIWPAVLSLSIFLPSSHQGSCPCQHLLISVTESLLDILWLPHIFSYFPLPDFLLEIHVILKKPTPSLLPGVKPRPLRLASSLHLPVATGLGLDISFKPLQSILGQILFWKWETQGTLSSLLDVNGLV